MNFQQMQRAEQINNTFRTLLGELMTHGDVKGIAGKGETRELLNYTTVHRLDSPQIVSLAKRKFNIEYLIREFDWYCSQSLSPYYLTDIAPFWKTLVDQYGEVVSNYGHWIFKDGFLSQFENCINILNRDLFSRQAVINIHTPETSKINPKDVPCTLSIQFIVNSFKELNMIVNMRSNDVITGWCNDVPQFQLIAIQLFYALKRIYPELKLGLYFHNAGSMHIYEKHYKMANELLRNVDIDPVAFNFANEFSNHVIFNQELGSITAADHLSKMQKIISESMKKLQNDSIRKAEPVAVDKDSEFFNILSDEGV